MQQLSMRKLLKKTLKNQLPPFVAERHFQASGYHGYPMIEEDVNG